jgi:hypothetical protein
MNADRLHSNHQGLRRSHILACVPAFLFAVYPLLLIVATNAPALPITWSIVLRDTALVALVVGVALWLCKWIVRDFVAGALWICCFLFLFGIYRLVMAAATGASLNPEDGRIAIAYTAAIAVLATIIVRPWQKRRRDPIPWNIAAAVFLIVNGHSIINSVHRLELPSSPPPSPRSEAPVRDVYYIVLDGFGRPDVLKTYYGLDLDSFVAFLHTHGFYVTDRASSNYAQTFLSLASTLNLRYLDDVAAASGRDSIDRTPLSQLIRSNQLMAIARAAGYEVTAIGSDYDATVRIDVADVCVCRQYGLDEIEQASIAATPLTGLPLGRWTSGAHRRKVLDSFDGLIHAGQSTKRRFVFAHIVAPHPPFVFWSNGTARQPKRMMFGFSDGDHYQGTRREYIDGYREQAQFVAQRLSAFIDDVLSRPGPRPVIVFHGDHGPGSMLKWNDPKGTNMSERMGIFSAYLFPDVPASLYPTISPVNGVRALATNYLGVNFPLLAERSLFSTWDRPYDFIDVTPTPTDGGQRQFTSGSHAIAATDRDGLSNAHNARGATVPSGTPSSADTGAQTHNQP